MHRFVDDGCLQTYGHSVNGSDSDGGASLMVVLVVAVTVAMMQ